MPTQPQWCAAFEITTDVEITLAFTDLTTKLLTIPAPGSLLYNDRTGNIGTDLLAWLADQMTTQDFGETWTASEPSGSYIGRPTLTNTHPRFDTKTLDTVTFTSGLTNVDLGFESATMNAFLDASGFDYAITGAWLRGRLWIAQESSFLALDEVTREDTVVVTTSPDGTNTKDYYGGLSMRATELLTVPAAIVWPHYANDALFTAAVSGMTAGDLNAPLDIFRQHWRDSSYPVRYSPDLTAPTVFYELEVVDPWIGSLKRVVNPIGLSPRLYNARLTALEV